MCEWRLPKRVPAMKYDTRERKRIQQQKIHELRHQLRYANNSQEREYITMQIDAVRRHG